MSVKQYHIKGNELVGFDVTDEKAQELIEVIGMAWEISPSNRVEPILQGAQADINFLLDVIDQLSRELRELEGKS